MKAAAKAIENYQRKNEGKETDKVCGNYTIEYLILL